MQEKAQLIGYWFCLLLINISNDSFRFIRMSSPRLNSITIIGSIFVYISVIISGLDGRFLTKSQYTIACRVCHAIVTMWLSHSRWCDVRSHVNVTISLSHSKWCGVCRVKVTLSRADCYTRDISYANVNKHSSSKNLMLFKFQWLTDPDVDILRWFYFGLRCHVFQNMARSYSIFEETRKKGKESIISHHLKKRFLLPFSYLQSIKDHQLLAMVAGLLLIDVIVLITWQLIDPLHYAIKFQPTVEVWLQLLYIDITSLIWLTVGFNRLI